MHHWLRLALPNLTSLPGACTSIKRCLCRKFILAVIVGEWLTFLKLKDFVIFKQVLAFLFTKQYLVWLFPESSLLQIFNC